MITKAIIGYGYGYGRAVKIKIDIAMVGLVLISNTLSAT
jgi:uncharacterized membrane protein (Fun14 family)